MHGRGLKIIFDAFLWENLNNEILPTTDYVGDLSAQDLTALNGAAPNSAAANDDAFIHQDGKRLIAKP